MKSGDIVLMGGFSGTSRLNDVWRSADGGMTWSRLTASAAWTARSTHTSVALSTGDIILMGGFTQAGVAVKDVWRSADGGATWSQLTGSAAWSARYWFNTVVLSSGELVITGGASSITDSTFLNDVWGSRGEVNWT